MTIKDKPAYICLELKGRLQPVNSKDKYSFERRLVLKCHISVSRGKLQALSAWSRWGQPAPPYRWVVERVAAVVHGVERRGDGSTHCNRHRQRGTRSRATELAVAVSPSPRSSPAPTSTATDPATAAAAADAAGPTPPAPARASAVAAAVAGPANPAADAAAAASAEAAGVAPAA